MTPKYQKFMSEYTNEYRIAQLLAKEITGPLSPEEEQELQKWKESSPTATKLHSRVANLSNKLERDEFIRELSVKSSWKKVEKRINRKKKSSNWIWWASSAAAVVFIATIGLVYFSPQKAIDKLPVAQIQTGGPKAILITSEGQQYRLSSQDSTRTLDLGAGFLAVTKGNTLAYVGNKDSIEHMGKNNTIRIPQGGEYELILPDGTHVWLNSDSQLSFPTRFSSTKREVLLSGEAYFDVSKMKDCPFIVKTTDIAIKVLGTQFNVQAYPNANTIETTLCEGSVNVSDGEQDVILQPSYQAVYVKANKNLSSRKVDTRLYTSWKDGLFVFEDKPLEEIMTTLARWYNINIFYANPAVKTYHFTGDLERYNDFQQSLNMIEKATSIKFVVNGNNVTVKEI